MRFKYPQGKATPGCTINWGLGLARDLKIYLPVNEGSGGILWNAVNGNPFLWTDGSGTAQSDYTWGENNGGIYTQNGSASDAALRCYQYPNGAAFYNSAGPCSWGGYAIFDNATGTFPTLFSRRVGGNYDWVLCAGVGGNWQAFSNVATTGAVSVTAAGILGVPQLVMVTMDMALMKIYVNGTLIASTTAVGAVTNNGGAITVSNHQVGLSSPVRYIKPIYAIYKWNRALAANEVRDLAANPFCLTYFPKRYLVKGTPVVPLTQSISDTIGTMLDAQSNTGTALGALSQSDQMVMSDAIALIGGNPDFQLILSDNLNHLADQLQSVVPVLLLALTDSLNNLSDSAVKTFGFPIAVFDSNQFNWSDVVTQLLAGFLQQNPSDSMNNLADAASVSLLNVPFLVAVSDTLNNLNDAVRLWNLLRLATGDQMVLSDAQRGRMAHLMRLADVLSTFLELVQKSFVNQPAFSDQMSLTDDVSISMAANLTASASDTLSMTDAALVAMAGNYNPATLISRIKRYLNDPQ